jgi:uncharacterized membrane protein YsdA (DUF1294 family)
MLDEQFFEISWNNLALKPLLVFGTIYLALSSISLIAYWYDKRAAKRKRARIRETYLLALGLAGGWPGAIVAQQTLHHKNRKASFQIAFWITVFLNVAAFIWISSKWL